MRIFIILLVTVFLPAIGFSQNTWYVPDDFWGIQAAISDASVMNGDTIMVRCGYYCDNLDFLGKAISVISEEGPDVTFIDGGQVDSVVKFINNEGPDSVLEGLTITNGVATFGGGIHCQQSSPTLSNNVIISNSAEDSGGGIYCNQSCPILQNNKIMMNQASWDGGGGGMANIDSHPSLTGCTFSGNVCCNGAGMRNIGSSPTLIDCDFLANYSGEYGAGAGMANIDFSSPTLTNCNFIANATGEEGHYGGGMYNYNESNPTLSHCIFRGNQVEYHGGGMCNYDSHPTLIDCTFTRNRAELGGGVLSYGSDSNMTRCTFNENRGGGICFGQGSNPTLMCCTIIGNFKASRGGGVRCTESNPTLINCIIANNTATYEGGGLYIWSNCNPILTNCTLFGNSATNGGGLYHHYSSTTVTNCILWCNTPDEINAQGSDPTVTFSCVQDGYSGTGNFDSDPCFLDAVNNDFHLSATSPCIDTGDNFALSLPQADYDGDPRIFPGNGSGHPQGAPSQNAVVDMGIDEFCLTNCSELIKR